LCRNCILEHAVEGNVNGKIEGAKKEEEDHMGKRRKRKR